MLPVSQAVFGMGNAQAEYEVSQAEEGVEQQAILDSISTKAEVDANHCYTCDRRREVDAIFMDMKSDE